MILGVPVFGAEAPALRVKGRRVSNWWARLETPGAASAIRCSASASIRSRRCSG
jgi:hypothetical protein